MITAKQVVETVRKMIEPLKRSIRLTIGRCVLDSIADSHGIQVAKVELFSDETLEMERFQNYGFSSNPPSQSEGICVFVGGNREHGICLGLDNRNLRPKGQVPEGGAAVYDATGIKLLLKNDGTVELGIQPGVFENIIKGVTFQALFNSHQHVSNVPGYNSSPPVVPSTPADLSQSAKVGL